ncbi:hypothetical protein QEH42_gp055 [Microbacterium phage Pumpernickel]|uniref:Uncharacterized protein n=1 Tax=Microbacterium phage Pumpernickel TaxID=2885983 RepID=A0AAE8Y8D2_9CAUD|nr:hypothetical protein QEH42_gp055 [Microbacterium phage Pumpernickel]UDL15846.1 hypothetical protein SEA_PUMPERNICKEL_55 [Microbacterium phage Pumpernickel]
MTTTELPTEPGVYRGREGDFFLLSSTSRVWRQIFDDFSGVASGILSPEYMLNRLPLTGFPGTEQAPAPAATSDPVSSRYTPLTGSWGVAMFGDMDDVINYYEDKALAFGSVEKQYGDILVRFLDGRWVEVM